MKNTEKNIYITPSGLRMGSAQYPCTIGRNGTSAKKSEGDGKTPEGEHEIIGMLYRPDRLIKPTDWAIPIRPNDIWSDDCNDPDYNMFNRAPSLFSHEKLFRADPLYDLVILTNWNWPYVVKGRGSAIFLHRWRKAGHPTEGCVALGPRHLLEVSKRIRFGTKVIVLPQKCVNRR